MGWIKKIANSAKGFASGLIKPIDDTFGTNFQDAWANEETKKATAKQQAFNAAEAQKNRDWQTTMSNNAHQREMADLEAAGLNPVLTAMGGQGAATGAGATTSVMPNEVQNTAKKLAKIEIESMKKQNEKINKENEKIDNEIYNNTRLTDAEIDKLNAETRQTNQNTEIGEPNAETAKALQWWNSTWAGKATAVIGDAIQRISPFSAYATVTSAKAQDRNSRTNRHAEIRKTKPKK